MYMRKVRKPKNVFKTEYVQKLFMGFERQQLVEKIENNMMFGERDGKKKNK